MTLPAVTLLAAVAALAGPPRTDVHGDPLPPGAVARFGTTHFRVGWMRMRHSQALSPDGKTLAVEDRDGIALWDTETGRLSRRLPCRPAQGDFPKFGLCFSPDGKWLARIAGRVVAVWDVATRKELFDIDYKQEGKFRAVAFILGKGQLIVTSEGRTLAWALDARTGKVVRATEFGSRCETFVPVGDWVVGFDHADWYLFDPATGKEKARFPNSDGGESDSFALSPDGKNFWLASRTGRLRRFETGTGKNVDEVAPPAGWGPGTPRPELGVSPDGAVIYLRAEWDSTVYRRDIRAGVWLPAINDRMPTALLPHLDRKRLLTIGLDGVLRHYDLATGNRLLASERFEGGVLAVPSPDGRYVAVMSGWSTHQLDVFDTRGRFQWSHGPYRPSCTPRWTPDGGCLVMVEPDSVRFRDPRTGKVLRTLRVPGEDQQFGDDFAVIPPGGSHLIVPADVGERVITFDLKTAEASVAQVPDGAGTSSLSPDGRLLLFHHYERGHRLFNLTNRKFVTDWFDAPDAERRTSEGNPGFTPDGSFLLTWDLEAEREPFGPRDSVAVLRDPRTGKRWRSMPVGVGGRFRWACSADGLWLAIGTDDGQVILFETATGQRLGRLSGHRDYIESIHFAGPARLLTASGDLTALLWDLRPRERPVKPVWDALGGTDAVEAWRAVWALAADPRGPELLRAKVTAPSRPSADHVKQWIANLGTDRYALREAATKELQALGRLVEPELRLAREQANAEEVRTRLDAVLGKITAERTPAELVRARAVAAMELVGTPPARKLLAEWAAGAPGARLTTDATAALRRLGTDR
jgi:WD40 repeat protein